MSGAVHGLSNWSLPLLCPPLQLSKVYQTMQTSVLCDLAKFSSRIEIEKFLVECVKNNTLQARLNHRSGTIRYTTGC